jgi:hypothetical protein
MKIIRASIAGFQMDLATGIPHLLTAGFGISENESFLQI